MSRRLKTKLLNFILNRLFQAELHETRAFFFSANTRLAQSRLAEEEDDERDLGQAEGVRFVFEKFGIRF